jgi:hypothetical protein
MSALVLGGVSDDIVLNGQLLERDRTPFDVAGYEFCPVRLLEGLSNPSAEARMLLGKNLGNIVIGDEPPGD